MWKVVRRKHGEGKVHLKNHSTYIGPWYEGKRHGIGFEHNKLGKYEGGFSEDFRKGLGKMRYANGDIWEGNMDINIIHEFSDGKTRDRGMKVGETLYSL